MMHAVAALYSYRLVGRGIRVQAEGQSDMLAAMVVLAFRHEPAEHLGWIGEALAKAGVDFAYVDLVDNPAMHVSLGDVAGMIFLGGSMSVNEDHAYLRRELGLIDQGLAAGLPMLGICLGAQLLAKALGAEVYRNSVPEHGWAPIWRTEAGHRDPLLSHLRDPEIVLHWHEETFDLPAGATWLAYSQACRHQAFRFGSNVYGFQFHLEATPEMIASWAAGCAGEPAKAEVDPALHCKRMREISQAVFGAWARLVRAAPAGAGA
jgi:GMP synthase (glutamine-hydrolysing)